MTTKCIESMEGVSVMPIAEGCSVLELGNQRFVLTYDVIYELALKFADHIQREDSLPPIQADWICQ